METVGAWLRLWTPPRDAIVPPVPWRRLAIGGLVAAIVLTGVGLLVIPDIGSSKRNAREREQAQENRRALAERRRLIAEQRPRFGRAPRPGGGGPLSRPRERRARQALLRRVEDSIAADARRRVRAGQLEGSIARVECSPAPASITRRGAEVTLRRSSDAYDCLAVTRDIPRSRLNVGGRLGYPFKAVVDFRRFRYAWCKTNPVAGERAVPDPRLVVPLPRACSGPRS
jgi:hypothetical protein